MPEIINRLASAKAAPVFSDDGSILLDGNALAMTCTVAARLARSGWPQTGHLDSIYLQLGLPSPLTPLVCVAATISVPPHQNSCQSSCATAVVP